METKEAGIVIRAGADLVSGLDMDPGLDNFRPPHRQKEILAHLAGRPDRMVTLARHGSTIVGYVVVRRVNPGPPPLYELHGIEVSPAWRGSGLAGKLLAATFADPVFDQGIVYVTGDPVFWDMDETGLNVWQYRRMLTKLYTAAGFTTVPARNPDVLYHVADLFMIRVGKDVPPGWEARCYAILGIGSKHQDEAGPPRDSAYFRNIGSTSAQTPGTG